MKRSREKQETEQEVENKFGKIYSQEYIPDLLMKWQEKGTGYQYNQGKGDSQQHEADIRRQFDETNIDPRKKS